MCVFVCVCVFVSINGSNVQLCSTLVTCDMKCDVVKHQLLNKFDRSIIDDTRLMFLNLNCDKNVVNKKRIEGILTFGLN